MTKQTEFVTGILSAFIAGKLRVLTGEKASSIALHLLDHYPDKMNQIIMDSINYLETLDSSCAESRAEMERINKFILLCVWSAGGRLVLKDRILLVEQDPTTGNISLYNEFPGLDED